MADTIRSEETLVNEVFKDGQADGSIVAQDMRDFVVSCKHLNGQGWDFHLDGTYTQASPRTILAGERTKVTINGTESDMGHPNVIHSQGHFWNTTTNKIQPTHLNDFGIARFAITASSASAFNYFDVEVDVGTGTFPIIWNETGVFAKGTGIDHSFNFNFLLFAGPDFVANGAEIFITPSADITCWNFAITSCRIYLAAQ